MGLGTCKGICDSHRIPKSKYFTHFYCRSCEWWIKQFDCQEEGKRNRCPCCGSLVSTKPRNSKAKAKYRLIDNG